MSITIILWIEINFETCLGSEVSTAYDSYNPG